MKNVNPSLFSRRHFFASSAGALGGLAIGASSLGIAADSMSGASAMSTGLGGGSELARPQASDRSVIDQIVRMYGGMGFKQSAAEKALQEAKEDPRKELPAYARAYRRRSHGIQAAMQAEEAGADAPMIVAALLHDIGHVFSPEAPVGVQHYDDKHEVYASMWLRNVFIPEVSEPIFRHVPAKRYLVTTRQEYWDKLSDGSKRSLEEQGGKMSARELEDFEVTAFSQEGVQIRLWDDKAKVKGLELEPIEKYIKLMKQTLRKTV